MLNEASYQKAAALFPLTLHPISIVGRWNSYRRKSFVSKKRTTSNAIRTIVYDIIILRIEPFEIAKVNWQLPVHPAKGL